MSLENAIALATQNRNDYKRAASAVRSAELLKQAAVDKLLPTVRFDGDVGGIGRSPGDARETYSAALSLNVPIFQGGRNRAEIQEADAILNQRKSELADFKARLDSDVRSNFLDLQTAIKQFQVARVSVTLADQQLAQSRDRFASGVAGSLEVTQSEEAVAAAADDYINSLYALNIAQALLARATGQAEQRIRQFLGER
jgi:outer membrane protein